MSSKSIKVLGSSSLRLVHHLETSGQMAQTHACRIQWSRSEDTKGYIKRFEHKNSLALCNEITGYLIAKGCDLPVPKFAGLIKVESQQFNDTTNDFSDWAFVVSSLPGSTPGSFYSVSDINNCAALMSLVAGWDKICDAIAFDDWVANEDRHLGNIMVEGKNKISLFDHSNLPITLNWEAKQLIPNYCANNVLLKNLYALNCTPLPVKSKVAHSTNEHSVVYNNISDELIYWWDILLEGKLDKRKALEAFLKSRANLGNKRVNEQLKMLA
jgi:hypothetical protein